MRSCKVARNVLLPLVSAFTLASAGTAFGGEQPKSKLPVVINNVHVPIGQNIFEGLDLGVWSSPYGVAANPRTRRFYSAELSGGGGLHA